MGAYFSGPHSQLWCNLDYAAKEKQTLKDTVLDMCTLKRFKSSFIKCKNKHSGHICSIFSINSEGMF